MKEIQKFVYHAREITIALGTDRLYHWTSDEAGDGWYSPGFATGWDAAEAARALIDRQMKRFAELYGIE